MLALALALVVLCGCGASTGPGATTTVSGGPNAARIAPRSFAVFRRPARAGDQIPTVQADGGAKPELSRLVYSGRFGLLYAYAHASVVCISYTSRVSAGGVGGGRGSCDAVANVSKLGAAAPLPASFDGIDRLALLLPDGVRQVSMIKVGGRRTTVPVVGNAVVYGESGLRAWSYTTGNGVAHTGVMPTGPSRPAPGH